MKLTEIKNRITELCSFGTRYGLSKSEEIELKFLVRMERKAIAKEGIS